MAGAGIEIQVRRPWRVGETVLLLGPGGVGKSTLGRELSKRLGWALIDLDLEFCKAIAEIGGFIRDRGYELYRAENLNLAQRLIAAADAPLLFVTSSGFLAAAPESDDYREARRLVEAGYGVTLLPSLDIETATSIVVARQLTRGFGFERDSEDRKFRMRFEVYRDTGDMLLVSASPSREIAGAIERYFVQDHLR